MNKYRKKPVVIEAMEWDSTFDLFDNLREKWAGFAESLSAWDVAASGKIVTYLRLKTLEGDLTVSDGDFIIKGIKGEFYSCKPDIFHNSYDVVVWVVNSCFVHDWKGTDPDCPHCLGK